MRSGTKSLTILLGCAWAAAAISAAAQPTKIGFVDIPRTERESKKVQEDIDKLKREFAPRQQALDEMNRKLTALQKQFNNLPASTDSAEREEQQRRVSDMTQRFEQTRRRLTEDVERRKAEERDRFFRDISVIVKKIAERQKLDLVLQDAVFASRAIDISDQVIRALDR